LIEQSGLNPAELRYLLEYALAREGKTNYISTTTFPNVTGQRPVESLEYFKEMKQNVEAVE
jgi:hypothetical protein